MATRFEIVIAAEESDVRAAAEAALEEIVQCHDRFTRFASDSLLSHIMRQGFTSAIRLDEDTYALFADALRMQEATGGAFSISLTAEPAFALNRDDRSIRLLRDGVALDLGAIAKGHALDLAARVLRDAGISSALLHGGTSSIYAIGVPPGSTGWSIRLAHAPNAEPRILRDRALSVSGTSGPITSTEARSHMLDARDSAMLPCRFAVVEGPTARGADGWATAAAVFGARPPGLSDAWSVELAEFNA